MQMVLAGLSAPPEGGGRQRSHLCALDLGGTATPAPP